MDSTVILGKQATLVCVIFKADSDDTEEFVIPQEAKRREAEKSATSRFIRFIWIPRFHAVNAKAKSFGCFFILLILLSI